MQQSRCQQLRWQQLRWQLNGWQYIRSTGGGCMIQGHGNWVVGDRFWDREMELKQFIGYVDEGAHLLLVAQRRMGKTSLMKEAARRIENRYVCLFIDLQKAMSPADAVVELSLAIHPYKSLWNKSAELFSNILGRMKDSIESLEFKDLGIKLREGLTSGNWISKGDQLLSILAESEKPVLVLIDEVPILVNRLLKDDDGNISTDGKKQADAFMSWLRNNSIRHQGKLRIVLSGSI
jgi:uncharacterized protein